MPTAPKEEEKKFKRDPLISSNAKAADPQIDAAIKRGGKAGLLKAANAKPGEIYSITIDGTKKIEASAVAFQLESKVGSSLDRQKIKEDIRSIHAMGLFSDVIVEKSENTDGSINITYKLTEKPTIRELKFKGNEFISDDDLKAAMDLQPYYIADLARIKRNISQLKKKYTEKGYYLADINYELIPADTAPQDEVSAQKNRPAIATEKVIAPDFVDVQFIINENARVMVESVSFIGNENLKSDEIKNVMRTREKHPLSFMTGWGNYDELAFEMDKLLIEQYYRENGYLNVQVGKPKVEISADKQRFRIVVPINEGKQFHLGSLDIIGDLVEADPDEIELKREEGKTVFDKNYLLKKFRLKKGDVFNQSTFGQDMLAISDEYQDEGYAYVNPTPMTSFNEESQSIDVQLEIDAGQKVYVEKINISGNNKTMEEVIRREIRLYEGELYSSSMLRLSEQRINQLGFFEEVSVTTKAGNKPETINVEIVVKERASGSFQLGAGYGTGGEGILLNGQISQQNLFGRAQTLSLQVQWSRFRRIFDVSFLDPYITTLAGEPLIFSFSAYNSQRIIGSFARNSTGGDIMFGYPIGKPYAGVSKNWRKHADLSAESYIPDFENLYLYLSYKAERVEVASDDTGVRFYALRTREPHYTTALGPMLQFDQRNNRLFPTKGFIFDLKTQIASTYFGAGGLSYIENQIMADARRKGLEGGSWFLDSQARSNNYFQLNTSARFYFDLDLQALKGVTARLNMSLGYMNSYGQLLLAENYYIGSQNTVRGYFPRSIGPVLMVSRHKPDAPPMDLIVGGTKQFLTNVELEFPIAKAVGLSAVLFLDLGNVYAADENYFYIGGRSKNYVNVTPNDPLGIFKATSLFASVGFGVRWMSPMGMLRFEWGIPLTPRKAGSPGRLEGDPPIMFEFGMGPSF